MKKNTMYLSLFEDFPELLSDNIILQKEVLAHFGLLFSGYALLEAAIQNFYIFSKQRRSVMNGEVKTKQDWQSHHDKLERRAFSATLGTLLNLVSDFPELSGELHELRSLKRSRDYFAHHFFREENGKFFTDDSSLHLIYGMNKLRHRVKEAERVVDVVTNEILKALHTDTDLAAALAEQVDKMRGDALSHPLIFKQLKKCQRMPYAPS